VSSDKVTRHNILEYLEALRAGPVTRGAVRDWPDAGMLGSPSHFVTGEHMT
jgi:hypothetical protein